MNGLGGTGGWHDQTAVRLTLTGEARSHPSASPAPYISSRRGGQELGSMCSEVVTTETAAAVQTLGDRTLGTHGEARVKQRDAWPRAARHDCYTCGCIGDGPSQLTSAPTATVSWDLTTPARALICVRMCPNLNHFLIFWKTQGFPHSVRGFERAGLVPQPQGPVTSQSSYLCPADCQEGPFPGSCSGQHISPAPLRPPHSFIRASVGGLSHDTLCSLAG